MTQNPLQAWLPIQMGNEKIINDQLRDAAREIEKIIKRSEKIPNRSSALNVRLAQYRVSLAEIQYTIRELWTGGIGPTIQAGIIESAEEAASLNVLTDVLLDETGIGRNTWEASVRQTARNNIEAYRQRVEGNSYVPLSNRVYRNAELANGAVDRVVSNALILGKSARELAMDVRGMIDPDVRGGISYAAQRLGRTELNNAFHATTIQHHGQMPWVKGMLWNLSGSHPRSDVCDDLSGKTYAVSETPAKPHPQCYCYVTPAVIGEDAFVKAFQRGDYNATIAEMMS